MQRLRFFVSGKIKEKHFVYHHKESVLSVPDYGIFLRQNGEPVNISLAKRNLGDIVKKTHVVLIIGQNKMCAKFRILPFDVIVSVF